MKTTRKKRTSIAIQRKITRLRAITAHISPHLNGLAPETKNFVAALNDEAERFRTGMKFTAYANRIDAAGNIGSAAESKTTLGGWFLRRAIRDGYLDGEAAVLKRGNSEHRKKLRRHAKTKAGYAAKATRARVIKDREITRRIAEAGDRFIGPSAIVPGSWPKAWIAGVYMPMPNSGRRKRIKSACQ